MITDKIDHLPNSVRKSYTYPHNEFRGTTRGAQKKENQLLSQHIPNMQAFTSSKVFIKFLA